MLSFFQDKKSSWLSISTNTDLHKINILGGVGCVNPPCPLCPLVDPLHRENARPLCSTGHMQMKPWTHSGILVHQQRVLGFWGWCRYRRESARETKAHCASKCLHTRYYVITVASVMDVPANQAWSIGVSKQQRRGKMWQRRRAASRKMSCVTSGVHGHGPRAALHDDC